jgi:16S rRNA (uracil1498-N3)-methyltransferase
VARRPRFHVEAPLRAGGVVRLSEEAGHHAVRVLRLRGGDEIVLFDGTGGEFDAAVESVQKATVHAQVLRHVAVERESPLRVTLVQGISSGERMEFTIRKAVELGVDEIVPLLSASSVARPKGERAAARQAHWQKIAVSACEQCGRNRIAVVQPLSDSIASLQPKADAMRILLAPGAPQRLSEVAKGGSSRFVLAAGPEAGFDEREEAQFMTAGFVAASLGPRVLRTETAALAALAALSALRGDF